MYRVRIPVRNEAEADILSDALADAFDPETSAVSMLETGKGWVGEAYYTEKPPQPALRAIVVRALGRTGAKRRITVEALADRNWVKDSLEAMPPVHAGRFTVYGHHDRHRVRANAVGIEIEAGMAFGTGHHGTTLGCLKALDRLLKYRRFTHPLDIGTGTGVLAIGLAKARHVKVMATDIDPIAVEVTRENAVKNGVGSTIRAFSANGVNQKAVQAGAPYDLVFANILAKPLVALAPRVRPLLVQGSVIILSGLLVSQRREVEAAWRAQGCVPLFRIDIDGWATLALEAR